MVDKLISLGTIPQFVKILKDVHKRISMMVHAITDHAVSLNTEDKNQIKGVEDLVDRIRSDILGTNTGGYPIVTSGTNLPQWVNFIHPYLDEFKEWLQQNVFHQH
jgi:hypothetical protein